MRHLHAKALTVHPEKLDEVGIFALPPEWHTPRVPGFGEMNGAQFMAKLYGTGYDGPVCTEVEDDTFGKTLAGCKQAVKVAGNILRPFLPVG